MLNINKLSSRLSNFTYSCLFPTPYSGYKNIGFNLLSCIDICINIHVQYSKCYNQCVTKQVCDSSTFHWLCTKYNRSGDRVIPDHQITPTVVIITLGYIKCVDGLQINTAFTSLTLSFYKTRVFNFLCWKEELFRKP